MWRRGDKKQERREQGKESGEVRKEKGMGEKSVCLAVQYFTKEFYMQPIRCQPKALFNSMLSQAAEDTLHLWVSLTAAASVFIKASGSQPVRLV